MSYGNSQAARTYGEAMPQLRIEIEATDRIEARRILALYSRGDRHPPLDDEVIDEAWKRGRTPIGDPVFVGLTNGSPIYYKFDVNVDSVTDA